MSKTRFRRPEQMSLRGEKKVLVSTRIFESSAEFLTREAERNGMTLSALVGSVMEDYKRWLYEQRQLEKRSQE